MYELILHVPVTVTASSMNIAKAALEAQAQALATERPALDATITLGTPSVSVVRGPRPT